MDDSYDFEVGFSRVFREGDGFKEGIAVIHIGCLHGGGERYCVEGRFALISYAF